MVQHAGADNLIEGLAETPNVFDREPMEIEVSQTVFSLKIASVAQTGFANVDPGYMRVRFAHRIGGGLRRAAAGDEDSSIRARRLPRPEEKRLRPPTIRVPVKFAMPVKVAERRRIWMALVKGPHLVGWIGIL
jgi:hypothetical protein